MAGLKKPAKKPSNANPNTVLVVFLVLFVLSTIGVGVWGYYGYQGQEELKKKAVDAANSTKTFQTLVNDYFSYLTLEFRQALGEELNADDHAALKLGREKKIIDEAGAGPFKDEKTQAIFAKAIKDLEVELGYDPAGAKYLASYKTKVELLKAELNRIKGESDANLRARNAANARYQPILDKYSQFQDDANKRIAAGNQAALDAARKRYKEMDEALSANEKLRNELVILKDTFDVEKEKLTLERNKALAEVAKIKVEKRDAQDANPRAAAGGAPHALVLDVSKGKSFWDSPVGKITRVETNHREVIINLGSADGAKKELCFNVFGAGWNLRADGPFKGTVEVIRVLDANSSVARVTSLYDLEGKEILLNDPSQRRVERETENPLKEGDLLFNLCWGTHVAITGQVNWSGFNAESPAAQMRNLQSFMALLQRQGVIIDAYLDLTDGTIKGAMTAKTRFLVRGDALYEPAAGGEEPGKAMEKEGEPKAPAEPKAPGEAREEVKGGAAGEVGLKRIQLVNDAIKAMRAEAIERGMFIISTENYANVIGYRPPRNANVLELSGFRPAQPSASSLPSLVLPGGNNPIAPAPPPENNEK